MMYINTSDLMFDGLLQFVEQFLVARNGTSQERLTVMNSSILESQIYLKE